MSTLAQLLSRFSEPPPPDSDSLLRRLVGRQGSDVVYEIANLLNASSMPISRWTVGVTDDADRRRGEHGQPPIWKSWLMRTETDARTAERSLIEHGMKGGGGGPGTAKFLYIFAQK